MNATHDEYVTWDAAYVLGGLSPSERAAYERHLAECPLCSEAVRELAVIPGLLGKVSPGDVPTDVVETVPTALLARTRSAARAELTRLRRPRRRVTSLVAAAASAVLVIGGVAVAGALESQHDHGAPPGVIVAMQQVHANPLSATARLVDKPWGTEVNMTCVYPKSGWNGRAVYALYIVDVAGHAKSIATWAAGPGSTSTLTAATAVPRSKIAYLQIRDAGGEVLLTANPD